MATAACNDDLAARNSLHASVALSKTPQMYLDILALLGQATQAVQSGARPQQTTAILQRAMTLVSSLSVAILVPDLKDDYDDSTLKSLGKLNLSAQEGEHDCSYVGFNGFSLSRSSSDDGSSFSTTPSSPPLPVSPAPSGGSSSKQSSVNRGVPGTPKHTLLPPGFASALLTPPSSEQKPVAKGLNTHVVPVFQTDDDFADRPVDLPAGFQSSLVPSVSEADFRARATFHRNHGCGVQVAYDITLSLHGATTIDGIVYQFTITDSYFNPESYNYSESLQTASGVTGYRYDNRNGSTYIRFDEPTGPRTQFVRHAHPPYIIGAGRSPASSLGSPFLGASKVRAPAQGLAHHHNAGYVASPTPNKGLGFVNMLATPPHELAFSRSPAAAAAAARGQFSSVADLWN